MLEQIHSAPEDRRVTNAALALTTLSFGALAAADSLATRSPAEAVIGLLTASVGVAGLRWMRRVPVRNA